MALRGGQGAFYRQIAAADQRFTDEIQNRYREMDIPVKVIWGREDSWIPLDRASQLAELIPGAEAGRHRRSKPSYPLRRHRAPRHRRCTAG